MNPDMRMEFPFFVLFVLCCLLVVAYVTSWSLIRRGHVVCVRVCV